MNCFENKQNLLLANNVDLWDKNEKMCPII